MLFSGVSIANFTHDCAVQIGIANVVGVDGKITKKIIRRLNFMTKLLLKLFVPNYAETQNGTVRQHVGKLSGVVGIVLNTLLAVAKIAIGLLFGVMSALADGMNNLTDCGSNVISLVSFKLAGKKADKDHPYGHQRIEYVSAMVVGVIVAVLALQLARDSIDKIISPEASEFSWWTVGVLGASIVVKLWMFLFNRKLGNTYGSELLKATATDSLSDSCATFGVLASVLVTKYTGFVYLDGIVGLAVAVLIGVAGVGILRDTMSKLLGKAPDKEVVDGIYNRIMQFDGVKGIHDLEVHNYGPNKFYASVHVEVDAAVDVMTSHELVDNIERDFAEHTDVTLVIHMDPIVVGDPVLDGYRKEVKQIVAQLDERFGVHDFRMVKGPQRINLIFDVAVTFDCAMSDGELRNYLQSKVAELHPNVYVVATVDRQSCEYTSQEN